MTGFVLHPEFALMKHEHQWAHLKNKIRNNFRWKEECYAYLFLHLFLASSLR